MDRQTGYHSGGKYRQYYLVIISIYFNCKRSTLYSATIISYFTRTTYLTFLIIQLLLNLNQFLNQMKIQELLNIFLFRFFFFFLNGEMIETQKGNMYNQVAPRNGFFKIGGVVNFWYRNILN